VCLNRFRNPIERPRPDSGLLRHRKKKYQLDTSIIGASLPILAYTKIATANSSPLMNTHTRLTRL
jgi:hypothetical protein